MAKMKICSCGKRINFNSICDCQKKISKQKKNQYQRKYYNKNKDTLKLLTQKKWRDLRKTIIYRDKGLCQRCLIKYKKINSNEIQVHHIKSRLNYPELMYDKDNLLTVCKSCNLELGTSDKLDFDLPDRDEIEFNL